MKFKAEAAEENKKQGIPRMTGSMWTDLAPAAPPRLWD
jgi:hypothetical protein